MIQLAIETGIPMSEWEAYGDRAIDTAWQLLEEAAEAAEEHRRRKG